MVLPRTSLMARLMASEPRVVTLCAPRGYGKASLARLFARRFERYGICDCEGARDLKGFADRALSALTDEFQGDGELARTRLRLHAGESDAATWCRALLDAWKGRHERSLLIFENADDVAEQSGIPALLGDLLAARPAERVVLISSRMPLPLRFSYYLAPHQILALAINDLRLDPVEAADAFDGTGVAPEIIDRIVRLAGGWPIVVFLLARFACYETDIETLIDRIENAGGARVYEHLVDDVLSALTPEMLSATLAVAAIPHAAPEDIAAATGIRHTTPIVDGLQRLPGFVSSENGYQTHAMLRDALRARYAPEISDSVRCAAHEFERLGDYLRAAELHQIDGDSEAAAGALDQLPASALQQPSSRLVDVLVKIEASVLCTFPNLWVGMLPFRRAHITAVKLFDEASHLLESLSPKAAPSLRRRLGARVAALALELERIAQARAIAECAEPGSAADGPEERRLVLMTSALIAAKQGRFSEAERFVEEADAVHGARHLHFDAERTAIAMERARLHGEWREWLTMSEDALNAARRSGITARIVDALRGVVSAAWYCNDESREGAARQMLEDCGGAGNASFPFGPVPAWQAALRTTDIGLAKTLAETAIDEADALGNDFLRIMLRASAALLVPSLRRLLLEARVIAQRLESPPLQASIELLIDSAETTSHGIFSQIAARVERSPLKTRQDVLAIDVIRGEVRRGGAAVHVSDRGFELVLALALFPAGTSKEELAAAIWPGLDGEAAINTLKMCVSRTRAQVADKEAIVSTKRGYALSEHVAVDVRELEALLRGIRGSHVLSDSARRRIEEADRVLSAHQRSYASGWVWFGVHASRLDAWHREIGLLLAKDAFRRDAPPRLVQPPVAPV
jgi:hypothetical protein